MGGGMADQSLGLEHGRVALAAHNEAWRTLFEQEALALHNALTRRVNGIEHVGSTSVPGIQAKPILDLMLGLRRLEDGPGLAAELAELGYEFRPDAGIPAEHVYAKGTPRTHLLHVVQYGGDAWQQKLSFRNALREDPELASAYQELKVALSNQFPDDRAAYTAGKTDFVRRVVSARLNVSSFHSRNR
jgi:GrpB-like predicted nucleotidyltransferase (UPF0157 family)